jgi:hypothetical protein
MLGDGWRPVLGSFSPVLYFTFLPNTNSRKGMKQSEYIQEPQDHNDDDHGVQDRLDASGHRDKAIHQPQQDAHYDQDCYKIDQRHDRFVSFFFRRHLASPVGDSCFYVGPRVLRKCGAAWNLKFWMVQAEAKDLVPHFGPFTSPTNCIVRGAGVDICPFADMFVFFFAGETGRC